MGLYKPLRGVFPVPSGRDGGGVPISQSPKSPNLKLGDSRHGAASGKFHLGDGAQSKHRLSKNTAGSYLRVTVEKAHAKCKGSVVESGLLPKMSPWSLPILKQKLENT